MAYTYEIKESARALSARITIHTDGRVVVTKPRFVSTAAVERFVRTKSLWIEAAVKKFQKRAEREAKNPKEQLPRLRRGSKAYIEAQKSARTLVIERVRHFSTAHGFTHGSISIRNQKSRWGSCSQKGNLSFNYRIVHLPSELTDYLVVHELAHTVHHNHSAKFWALVGSVIPEHKKLRIKLKRSYVF